MMNITHISRCVCQNFIIHLLTWQANSFLNNSTNFCHGRFSSADIPFIGITMTEICTAKLYRPYQGLVPKTTTAKPTFPPCIESGLGLPNDYARRRAEIMIQLFSLYHEWSLAARVNEPLVGFGILWLGILKPKLHLWSLIVRLGGFPVDIVDVTKQGRIQFYSYAIRGTCYHS